MNDTSMTRKTDPKYDDDLVNKRYVDKQVSNNHGDTIPIGSIFDYDGNTVPDGYEQVNSYSTTEVKTGDTWIDGKPIYRKVIDLGQLPNNSTKSVASGLNSGLINVTHLYGVARTNTGYQAGLNDNITRLILLPNDTLEITTNADFSPFYGIAIIEYTKTTG